MFLGIDEKWHVGGNFKYINSFLGLFYMRRGAMQCINKYKYQLIFHLSMLKVLLIFRQQSFY